MTAVSDPPGPYDALEPERPRPVADRSGNEPGAVVAVARGLTRRCPRCGSGDLFERWFTIRERCPRCSLRLQREEGGFLGAMTLNYAVTAAAWLAVLVTWLVVDLPDVHVAALTIVSLAVAALAPVLVFPFAKTTWAAVDYLVYRSTPGYAPDAARRAGGGGGRS